MPIEIYCIVDSPSRATRSSRQQPLAVHCCQNRWREAAAGSALAVAAAVGGDAAVAVRGAADRRGRAGDAREQRWLHVCDDQRAALDAALEVRRRPPRGSSAAMSSDGAKPARRASGDDAKVKRLLKAKADVNFDARAQRAGVETEELTTTASRRYRRRRPAPGAGALLLLKAKASVDIETRWAHAHCTTHESNEAACARLLIKEANATVDIRDNTGCTLYHACEDGNVECVQLLLGLKAAVDVRCSPTESTPLNVARQGHWRACTCCSRLRRRWTLRTRVSQRLSNRLANRVRRADAARRGIRLRWEMGETASMSRGSRAAPRASLLDPDAAALPEAEPAPEAAPEAKPHVPSTSATSW